MDFSTKAAATFSANGATTIGGVPAHVENAAAARAALALDGSTGLVFSPPNSDTGFDPHSNRRNVCLVRFVLNELDSSLDWHTPFRVEVEEQAFTTRSDYDQSYSGIEDSPANKTGFLTFKGRYANSSAGDNIGIQACRLGVFVGGAISPPFAHVARAYFFPEGIAGQTCHIYSGSSLATLAPYASILPPSSAAAPFAGGNTGALSDWALVVGAGRNSASPTGNISHTLKKLRFFTQR